MTMPASSTAVTRETAAAARSREVTQRTNRPSARRDRSDDRLAYRSPYRPAAAATPPMRAELSVQRGTIAGEPDPGDVTIRGYATVYERTYEMWDMWGLYDEIVSAGAGELSLARNPDVKFLFNHRDMPMARTREAGTLQLAEDEHGLSSTAQPLMTLRVAREVTAGIEARLIDEMSFAFVIVRGEWSPDFMTYRIHEYDIHRGDTSAVTYGANPHTEIDLEREAEQAATRNLLTPARQASARQALYGHLAR
jgi:HK97 family phage prohead protease